MNPTSHLSREALNVGFADQFALDPGIDYLNHGSFGACPRAVLDAQHAWRERLERGPTRFLGRELEGLIDTARRALAQLIDAPAEQLAFVPNATTGVNIVLGSLQLAPGDELLMTDHTYNACKNALAHFAEKAGARAVVAHVPFPLASEDEVVRAIEAGVSPRTRLLLIDHVTSPTGLVMPIERIIAAMRARGVPVLVDGAHAPGMLALSLRAIGADYYTGNCHKWLCTPKGSAFLHVAEQHLGDARPLVISHGASSWRFRNDRPRFWLEHDWVGTVDPTPFLCIPSAIDQLSSFLPGGLPALQQRNRALALEARKLLCGALGIAAPAPDSMIAALVAVPLPDAREPPTTFFDGLQTRLYDEHRIEAIVSYFPGYPRRLLRVSAQAYNTLPQYERLARVLESELAKAREN
jgi:isopenicillin-N epimerase